MKTIEQLEKEVKQAREDMRQLMLDEFGIGATLSDRILSIMIRAVQSNIAHNDAKQEVSGDGSGESLPEYIEKKGLINIAASNDYLTGDGSGKSLPEVRQEERDSDGWIKWNGGRCPVKENEMVEAKFRSKEVINRIDYAWRHRWHHAHKSCFLDGLPKFDIVAYRIVKEE